MTVATTLPTSTHGLVEIPVGMIRPSKTNPRRVINGHAFDELTASVAAHGVLQPVLVRPVSVKAIEPKGATANFYELVAGHRRFAAAQKAGLERIPAAVRDLTDVEALEIQLIENLERSDLHPLEEAQGYSQLMVVHKYDVARIAEKIGRSIKYVYDRVKLLQLTKEAQQLFLEDRITAGHAILLARLKPADQKRAIDPDTNEHRPALFQKEHTLFDPGEQAEEPFKLKGKDPWKGLKARSVRELQGWIDEHVRFDAKEPDPILFPETKAELEGAKKIVPITLANYIPEEAREGRTWGPRSWKRADGQPYSDSWGRKQKSKTCEYSVTGFVAVGPGRGDAFPVCVNKDKCAIHWPDQVRAKKRRSAAVAGKPTKTAPSKPAKAKPEKRVIQPYEIEREAADAISEAVVSKAEGLSPDKFLRIFALAYVCNTGMASELKGMPLAKLQARLALELMDQIGEACELAEAFGIDPKPFLAAAKERLTKPKAGTCSECGCTENDACEDGCSWANQEKTLCTSCAPSTGSTEKGRNVRKARKSGSGKPRAKARKKK